MRKKYILIIMVFITAFVISIFFLGIYREYANQNNPSVSVNPKEEDNEIQTISPQVIFAQNNSLLEEAVPAVSQDNSVSVDGKWAAIERKNNYNGELQFYSKQNVEFSGGSIRIYSRKENKEGKKYTSGRVETSSAYLYGDFEFNIKIDKGKGLFPAIWLLPLQDKEFPEIDIFEMIGSEPLDFYGVEHYEQQSVLKKDYFIFRAKPSEMYNIRFVWTKEGLDWFIDGKSIYSTKKYVPQEYMYLIANQAVGGTWPGDPDETTVFPSTFEIASYSIKPEKEVGR